MSQFILPQGDGPNLIVELNRTDGGDQILKITPEQGVLFGKTMSDGRKIEALSISWRGGFLALVEFKIDGQYAEQGPYTRVDLGIGHGVGCKAIDVFEEAERQFFAEQGPNLNQCLTVCADFVKHRMVPAISPAPGLK